MDADEWNDSLRGDYLWTSGNVGEAMPDVMTPCSWSAIQRSAAESMGPRIVAGHPYWGVIGGRFYINLTVALSVARRFRTTGLFREVTDRGIGLVPSGVTVPLVDLPFWRTLRDVGLREAAIQIGSVVRRRSARRTMGELPARCAELRDRIAEAATTDGLVALWHTEVDPLFAACCALMRHARPEAMRQAITHRLLRRLMGEDLANAVTTGARDDHLASLDLVLGLEALAAGTIDRATFARLYGHRGPHEYELSRPRSGEDPDWIDRQLTMIAPGAVRARLAERADRRRRAWREVAGLGPLTAAAARPLARAWARSARRREALRSASVRGLWVLRTFVQRAGDVTGHGDDLWYLTLDEIVAVLDGNPDAAAPVGTRRATVQRYSALPTYPTFIRGHFDPERWARAHTEPDPGEPTSPNRDRTLTGWPGSDGLVHGSARVVLDLDRADSLQPGEILVTHLTNVGWTPVFVHAAAVVTDVGAPLSHAAIVARELGIPAVVGCTDATTRIRTGDRLTVDGARGTVCWT